MTDRKAEIPGGKTCRTSLSSAAVNADRLVSTTHNHTNTQVINHTIETHIKQYYFYQALIEQDLCE